MRETADSYPIPAAACASHSIQGSPERWPHADGWPTYGLRRKGVEKMSFGVIRRIGAAGTVVLALVAAQAALAARAEAPVVRFTAADQAAAKAAVLKLTDFDPGAGWKGGLEKNAKAFIGDICPGLYDPKQADLVITGVAKSGFKAEGVQVSSGVQVYKTARMARLDWDRSVRDPASIACARKHALASLSPGMRFVSLKAISFPRVGERVTRHRLVLDVTPAGATKPVRLLFDTVALGRGRTGISFSFAIAYTHRAAADAAEVRIARILDSRIRV